MSVVPDDKRMVTTTVARLKRYEAAVRSRGALLLTKMRAADALEAAQRAYETAMLAESNAIDEELDAARLLHEELQEKPA